ncbi:acyl-CoA carboxylase subunit epsilon [Sphaerisporangium aureirubrum]|uniref:Acyl-CoA carboxylase subunit epsilon n=1 Tax=Sphaerisporangium aureirubrum TaxID=1544736 RepID=A0ABW1NAC6_9ACTN
MSQAPFVKVVHGNPTPEELAALVAVLTMLDTPPDPDPHPPTSTWSDPTHSTRRPLPSPGTWRSSGWTS